MNILQHLRAKQPCFSALFKVPFWAWGFCWEPSPDELDKPSGIQQSDHWIERDRSAAKLQVQCPTFQVLLDFSEIEGFEGHGQTFFVSSTAFCPIPQVQLAARRRRSKDVEKLDPFKHLTLGSTWHHLVSLGSEMFRGFHLSDGIFIAARRFACADVCWSSC